MTIKKLVLISICLITMLQSINAQDNKQMAYNNRHRTSVDAFKTIKILYDYEHPSSDVYDNWENINIHAKTENIPNRYKVDLRDFAMPIDNNSITSHFGYRRQFKRNHYGIDFKANRGDTIRAAFGGKVRVVKNSPNGYGKVIVIRHHNGLETVYAHLSKQIVKANDHVKAGQPIGLAGNTGRSTGTHLHFETRLCGIAINPTQLFSFKNEDVVDDFYIWIKNKSVVK